MKYLLSLIVALSIFVNPVNAFAEELILAGGCFWCLEHDLESLKGITLVQSGYSGGNLQNPTYENHEGHQEVVLVDYDSQLVNLPEILRLYFRNIDPLDGKGQFCDRGDSYRPVIFFKDEMEESDAKNAILSASNELRVPLEKISVELKSKVCSKFFEVGKIIFISPFHAFLIASFGAIHKLFVSSFPSCKVG